MLTDQGKKEADNLQGHSAMKVWMTTVAKTDQIENQDTQKDGQYLILCLSVDGGREDKKEDMFSFC